MTLEKNSGIEIRQLANGYVVMPAAYERIGAQSDECRFVFQSMSGLIEFLSAHFDHREEFIQGDKP